MSNKIKAQFWGILILLALIALLVACSSPDDRQMVEAAKQYLAEKDIRKAALELKGALQKNPANGEARYLMGQINLDIGDSAAAEKEFRHAHKLGWQEEDVQVGLAKALINTQKYQDVIGEVEIKDAYSPTSRANLYGLLALAQAGLGKMTQAMATLAVGTEIDANAVQLLKSGIQLSLLRGDLDDSISRLKLALPVHPDNPELLLLSAKAAIQSNDFAGAMQIFQSIIDQDSSKHFTVYSLNARLGLARLEILDQKLDQAQSTLAPLVKMNASEPEINFLVGWLAFAQGKYESAEEHLFKVLQVDPEHSQTHFLFGIINYAQQDYELAAYYLVKYINTVPEDISARKLLGRTYLMLGQPAEAQTTLQTGVEKAADDAELLALVGLSHLHEGNIVSGIRGLENALKVNPESSDLRRELVKAYISTGEADDAIQQLKIILSEGDENQQTETMLVIAYLRGGNIDQAITTVLSMLTLNPNDPAVLTLAGNVFITSEDKLEARNYFNKALQIKPDYVPATMSLSSLEEMQGRYSEAEALYKGIIDTDVKSVAPLLAMARMSKLLGKKKETFGWLEQAYERAPRDIETRVMLAEYYLREKQIQKADSLIKEAFKTGSRDPVLLVLQSRILMAVGRYKEASQLLNELLKTKTDAVIVRILLSETYFNLGQEKDARKQLEFILEKQAGYIPALMLLARVDLETGYYQQALEYLDQVQKIQPDLPMSYELAGDAWIARNEHVKALSAYKKVWSLEPSGALAVKLSEALTQSGMSEEAHAVLLAWLDDHPDDARSLQFLGTGYQNIGLNDKAIQIYEKVLAVQPDNVVALNNLAWLYSLSNDPKALKLAERAYQEYPDNVGIQDTYGWLLVKQGQVDKGRDLLQQAMEELSDVSEVRYHYAVALLKSGEKTEARKRLKQLLQSTGSFEGKEDIKSLLDERS